MRQPLSVGLVLFDGLTQLDLTGPYEVFARLPGAEIHLLWKNAEPVRTEHGLASRTVVGISASPCSVRTGSAFFHSRWISAPGRRANTS